MDVFDALMGIVVSRLGITQAEVDDHMAQQAERLMSEKTRVAAQTQMRNPRGSSTPLPQSVSKAEMAVDKIEKEAQTLALQAVGNILALQVARADAARLKEALDRDRVRDDHRRQDGLYENTRDFANDLHKFGCSNWHLSQLPRRQRLIIADMIRWYAKDPRRGIPDNPWPDIDRIYDARTLTMPKEHDKVQRSRRKEATEMVDPALPAHSEIPVTLLDHVTAKAAATPIPSSMSPAPVEDIPPETLPAGVKWRALDEVAALGIATAIFDGDPIRRGLYWLRTELQPGDFGPELAPALRNAIDSGNSWSGTAHFLAAVERGRAREFIKDDRERAIRLLQKNLLIGEEKALEKARVAGFEL